VRYGDKDIKIDPGVFVSLKNGKITDKYKVGSTLGEGAFGVVQLVTTKVGSKSHFIHLFNYSPYYSFSIIHHINNTLRFAESHENYQENQYLRAWQEQDVRWGSDS